MSEQQQWMRILQEIKPHYHPEQSYIVDLAVTDWNARIAVALTLFQAHEVDKAVELLSSITSEPESEELEKERSRFSARIELATILMEELKYAEAEDELWIAKKTFKPEFHEDFTREDIALLITQCRFGQGFVQEAIDRTEEIVRKLKSLNVSDETMAKTYQQMGWYYFHKNDVPIALDYIKQAMQLTKELDREQVDAGLAAEQEGNFEKAVEHYFDSIVYEG